MTSKVELTGVHASLLMHDWGVVRANACEAKKCDDIAIISIAQNHPG